MWCVVVCDIETSWMRRSWLAILLFVLFVLSSLVTGLFFPVLLLNQRWSPPLTLQASQCSTFRNICDIPSIAVFCSESIECFPGTVSKFSPKFLVNIPVVSIIIIIIIIDIPCPRLFLPGTSLEPAVIPTAQASSFTLQYFPYYVCCSKYSCLL